MEKHQKKNFRLTSPQPMLPAITLLLLCRGGVLGGLNIYNEEVFVGFLNSVNSGSIYPGTTIYLNSDLDFSSPSSQFQPIGNDTSHSFNGTFDGNGYVISNLSLSSSSQFVGLFGYTKGTTTIKNIVLGESCSFISSHSASNPDLDIGGIVGRCESCTIENVVNMGSITFTGRKNFNINVRIGGVVGRLLHLSTIKNCVNYGLVSFFGISTSTYLGGIVGMCEESLAISIQNCANYGILIYNDTSILYVGGILGNTYTGTISVENCVSAGKIDNTTKGSTNNHIGSIAGYANSNTTTITHCLWTSDVGYNDAYGCKETSATVTVTYSNLATLDATTMDELNEYAEENSWDKWFMLHLNGGTINNLTQDTLIVTQKHFPVPVKEGYTFSFWCMDDKCTNVYDPDTIDITAITDLYALWNMTAVTFDFENGTATTKNVVRGEKYGALPEAGERTGYIFIGWFTGKDGGGDEITNETYMNTTKDHTLYARWTINSYILTFILDNGENDIIRMLNYNETIDFPKNPTKKGFTFDGWSPNTITMPEHDLNITTQWISACVEIVFNKKLIEDDIKVIIDKYASYDNFVIDKVEINRESGETKVIIKFADEKKAKNFVEEIKASSNIINDVAKIGFVLEQVSSFSLGFYPSLFISLLA